MRESAPGADAGERLAKSEQDLDQCWGSASAGRNAKSATTPGRHGPGDIDTAEGYTG